MKTKLMGAVKGSLFTLIALFILSCSIVHAQKIENVRAKIENNLVIVSYDLMAPADNDWTFDVYLYSSVNKYTQPLERVSGDIGKNITPGKNKEITWNFGNEIVKFRGEVVFELQVRVFKPFLSFQNPYEGSSFRRGKTNKIDWKGGPQNANLKLELYHDGYKVNTIENTENHGSFRWNIPKNIKPGKGYQIKATNSRNQDAVAFSPEFGIKPKIPLMIKLTPVLAVGVGVYFLLDILSGDGPVKPDDNRIQDPPNPGDI